MTLLTLADTRRRRRERERERERERRGRIYLQSTGDCGGGFIYDQQQERRCVA